MLDLIEGADDDAEIAANSFNILSRLCDHDSGLVAVGNTKALEISIEWLQNNMEDAPPEATAACLRLMEKLCPLDGTVPQLQVRAADHGLEISFCCFLFYIEYIFVILTFNDCGWGEQVNPQDNHVLSQRIAIVQS